MTPLTDTVECPSMTQLAEEREPDLASTSLTHDSRQSSLELSGLQPAPDSLCPAATLSAAAPYVKHQSSMDVICWLWKSVSIRFYLEAIEHD